MKPELTLIPKATIHPNQINIYNEIHWHPYKPSKKNNNFETAYPNWKNEKFIQSTRTANGKVSINARRKITKAVDYLLFLTSDKKVQNRFTGRTFSFKIAFITLTLPSTQIHSDNEIKNSCLNQFLIEIKKFYKVKNYIWRAEQQENNNIHFHIIIDKFIPHQEIRDRWNRITEKLGYVTRYREEQQNWHSNGFKVRKHLLKTWPLEKQLAAYNRGAKTHWNSPNSTDIHSVQKILNLKAYVIKYMTKQPEPDKEKPTETKEPVKQQGRIWGCNYELSNIKGAQIDVDSITDNELSKLLQDPSLHKYQGDYFTCIFITSQQLEKLNCDSLFKAFANYMFKTFNKPIQKSFIT